MNSHWAKKSRVAFALATVAHVLGWAAFLWIVLWPNFYQAFRQLRSVLMVLISTEVFRQLWSTLMGQVQRKVLKSTVTLRSPRSMDIGS